MWDLARSSSSYKALCRREHSRSSERLEGEIFIAPTTYKPEDLRESRD